MRLMVMGLFLAFGIVTSACAGSEGERRVVPDATVSVTVDGISVSSASGELSPDTGSVVDVQMFTPAGERLGSFDLESEPQGSIRCAKCVCDLNNGTCVCEGCEF